MPHHWELVQALYFSPWYDLSQPNLAIISCMVPILSFFLLHIPARKPNLIHQDAHFCNIFLQVLGPQYLNHITEKSLNAANVILCEGDAMLRFQKSHAISVCSFSLHLVWKHQSPSHEHHVATYCKWGGTIWCFVCRETLLSQLVWTSRQIAKQLQRLWYNKYKGACIGRPPNA